MYIYIYYMYIFEKYMIIYIYIIHYTRIRDSLSVFIRTQHPYIPQETSPLRASRLFYPSVQSKIPSCLPAFLPPSLPPEESSRALPILQYLYFSMLKPRYIINYINKLQSTVSRMNVTYSLRLKKFSLSFL